MEPVIKGQQYDMIQKCNNVQRWSASLSHMTENKKRSETQKLIKSKSSLRPKGSVEEKEQKNSLPSHV